LVTVVLVKPVEVMAPSMRNSPPTSPATLTPIAFSPVAETAPVPMVAPPPPTALPI
jgi:hypothetical protein